MNKELKFIVGGFLTIISILIGSKVLSIIIDVNTPMLGKFLFAAVFLIFSLLGLGLIADSLLNK